MTQPLAPVYSVVIPVFNEEANLEPLLNELAGVMQRLAKPFEVIAVDDCSTDGSLAALKRLRQSRPWLRIIRHRLNSGESAASLTGFRFARGEAVFSMDADQQNDPADIPMLLENLRPEIAAVCGVRRKREDDWVRKVSSRLANWFRNSLTGDQIADAGCTFRALRRTALADLPAFNGLHRFLPTILRYQGYQVVEVLVNHRARTRGQSKYGVHNRLWRGLRDCWAMRWYRARVLQGNRIAGED
jgi:glycosyltransferase involved in cell wall biosynthesis